MSKHVYIYFHEDTTQAQVDALVDAITEWLEHNNVTAVQEMGDDDEQQGSET